MSKKREKKISIEEIYQNKKFVPPKEKNLETIFEEPRKSKDGAPILTSVRKYRRYLHFDPTEGKIQKRKIKAKKCVKKMKCARLRTRSSAVTENANDIMYVLNALGDISDDSDVEGKHSDIYQKCDIKFEAAGNTAKEEKKSETTVEGTGSPKNQWTGEIHDPVTSKCTTLNRDEAMLSSACDFETGRENDTFSTSELEDKRSFCDHSKKEECEISPRRTSCCIA